MSSETTPLLTSHADDDTNNTTPTLLRSTPDPAASNASSRLLNNLLNPTILIAILPCLPFWALRYLIAPPPGFARLSTFLIARTLRTWGLLNPLLPAVETDAQAEAVPPPFEPYKAAREGVDCLVVHAPPAPDSLCVGYAECPPGVEAVARPLFILTPEGAKGKGTERAHPGELAIIYFFGGGYTMGHPVKGHFAWQNAKDTKLRTFAINYRKVTTVATAFPAPLLDALAAWEYTLSLGFDPARIIVLGDSAGGHLALALTVHLALLNRPVPGALALCSPAVGMTLSHYNDCIGQGPDDYTVIRRGKVGKTAAMRWYTPEAAAGPVFSPLLSNEGAWGRYKGKVLVSVGGRETSAKPIKAFAAKLANEGVDVKLIDHPDGYHCGPVVTFGGQFEYDDWRDGMLEIVKAIE